MIDLGRTRTVQIAVVFIVVIAIGLSAATISALEGDELGLGEDSEIAAPDAPGSQGTVDVNPGDKASEGDGTAPVLIAQICITALRSPLAVLGILASIGVILGASYWRYNFATMFLFGTALVPPVIGAYFFLTNCTSGEDAHQGIFGVTQNPVGDAGGGGLSGLPIPPSLIAVAVIGLIGVAAFAVVSSTRSDELIEPELAEEDPEIDADAFARAAGRAADRIEEANASVDNAVYRAWLEMTQLLDMPNPETSTPRDFAERAIEGGFAREDVEELTELFVEVRYGGHSADAREDRAVEVLRNIEQTYSEGRMSSDE